MSDDHKKRASKIIDRHKREKQSRKPAPLPVRSTPDIFASSEATHLLEKAEETALLDVIDDAPPVSSTAFSQIPQKTQILTLDPAQTAAQTNKSHGHPISVPDHKQHSSNDTDGAQASTTQLLDAPDLTGHAVFDSSDTTRALSGMFEEEEEKTAFFHTHDERAVPKPPPAESSPANALVDPTPRQTLNQQPTSSSPRRLERASQAPSPAPRRSNSRREGAAQTQEQPEEPSVSSSTNIKPAHSRQEEMNQPKARGRRSQATKDGAAPQIQALNQGVFSEDASVVIDDVIDEVVKDSWKSVPSHSAAELDSERSEARGTHLKPKTLWLRIGLGFIGLIALGFFFSSTPGPRETFDRKRSSSVTTPLSEQVITLGLTLPLSDSARKLRPGTDVFVLGRRRVLLIINGADQSQLIHTDSLLRTLKSNTKLTDVKQQLSAIQSWPVEITVGLDRSTPISQVQRFCAVLNDVGVQRINLLTDSENQGGVGELGMDVTSKTGAIPSIGALEMKVESALISLSLIIPKRPPERLHSLDAFTPKLHKKLDEHIETFAFEHPRIVRAFVKVPEGLRLSQIVELARPLLRDERMRRVTIIPYRSSPGNSE